MSVTYLGVFLLLQTSLSTLVKASAVDQPLPQASMKPGKPGCEPLPLCTRSTSHPSECRRENQIYSVEGQLCINAGEKGICNVLHPLIAINFGSPDSVLHPEGINYITETQFPKDDRHGIYVPKETPSESIIAVPPSYKPLLQTGFIGNPGICHVEIDSCITYKLSSQYLLPGQYEIGIRFIQAPENKRGYRRFNVFLSGKLLVQDFDLMRATDQPFYPVTVNINMAVDDNNIVFGQGFYPLDNPLQLAFCFGHCGEPKGYIIAGFHILRLGNKPSCYRKKCNKPVPSLSHSFRSNSNSEIKPKKKCRKLNSEVKPQS